MEKIKIPPWLTVLSHIAVPTAFAYLAYLEISQKLNVRWETLGCFVLATLPFILVLLTRYINVGGGVKLA